VKTVKVERSMQEQPEQNRPGRTCPLSYRYGAQSLNRAADFSAQTIYVIGGLYGNPFALDALLRLKEIEPDAQLVFNGDFNWFDIDDTSFTRINNEVLSHRAIRGNVETELLAEDAAAGCGCGYPDYVSDADVARSNAMMGMLSATAKRQRGLSERIAALPMNLVAEVALEGGSGSHRSGSPGSYGSGPKPIRIGIVHGDAESLAGWSFGEEAIAPAQMPGMFERARVRAFTSSHTCLPVGETYATALGVSALFNNGAAGMPNFAGTTYGLITRISALPVPHALGALYGTVIDGAHLDCVPLHYDQTAWLRHFDHLWPADSPAALSYRKRIVNGPAYTLPQAMRGAVRSSDPAADTYKAQVTALAA
jgi:hypothetical protein